MDKPMQARPAKRLSPTAAAAFKRARKNIAKALADPQVKAAIQTQREALERDRVDRSQ